MREWSHGGVTLDHCNRCKGLWFDANELNRHFANLRARPPEELIESGDWFDR